MKRAKMMVTALALLGIVSGAMAFKAQKFHKFFVYQLQADGTCPALLGQWDPNANTGITLSSIFETELAVGTTTDPAVCTSSDILTQEN